ncbi:MAG: YbjQ family protein [Phycisphaerae bacterium]
MWNCNKCGKANVDGMDHCVYCREPLKMAEEIEGAGKRFPPPSPQEEKSLLDEQETPPPAPDEVDPDLSAEVVAEASDEPPSTTAEAEGEWICPACGEAVPANFDICHNCGCDRAGNRDPSFVPVDADDPRAGRGFGRRMDSHHMPDTLLGVVGSGYRAAERTAPPPPPGQKPMPAPDIGSILLSTLETLEGRPTAQVLGVVCGDGRVDTSAYAPSDEECCEALQKARGQAMKRLLHNAAAMRAHAVLGIRFEAFDLGKEVRMLTATGTAVTLK